MLKKSKWLSSAKNINVTKTKMTTMWCVMKIDGEIFNILYWFSWIFMYRLLAYVSFRNKGHRALLVKHISNISGLQNWFKSYCRALTSCELYLDLRWFIFDDPGIYKWRKYWRTKTFCNYVMINLQTKLNIILQFKEVLVFLVNVKKVFDCDDIMRGWFDLN